MTAKQGMKRWRKFLALHGWPEVTLNVIMKWEEWRKRDQ